MPVVTKDPHTWFICTNKAGDKQTVYNNEIYGHNFRIGFEVNFSDNPTPGVNTVTLYNMSKTHRAFYQKKEKCVLYFNWGKSKKELCEGYITKVGINQTDGVTDTMVLTFTEGTDYNNLKAQTMKLGKKKTVHKSKTVRVKGKNGKMKNKRVRTRATKTVLVNKTYPRGRRYKQLIQGIAKQAGIKIAKLDLAKNPIMKKAYTAKGKPMLLIEQLLTKCGSKVTYVRGKFEIVNPKKSKRTWTVIDDNDLITPPAYNESDDGKDGTWEITFPLDPDISQNAGIIMKSRYLSGRFYVKAGKHSNDGENPQTQCSLAKI